jgi:hypothetical protein
MFKERLCFVEEEYFLKVGSPKADPEMQLHVHVIYSEEFLKKW